MKGKKSIPHRICRHIKNTENKFFTELARKLKLESRSLFSLFGTTATMPYDCKHFLIGSVTICLAILGFTMPISSNIIIPFLLRTDIMNT